MASRTISIKVVYENKEAIIAARAQAIANRAVADSTQKAALAAQKLATEEQKTAKASIVTSTAQARLNTALQGTSKATIDASVSQAKLDTNLHRATKASTEAALAQHKLSAALAKTAKETESHSRSFGDLVKYTAKLYGSFQLVSKSVGLVSRELGQAVTNALDLQKSMTLLGAAGSLNPEQMEQVRGAIHNLASELPIAQTEIAAGALELVRMGYSGQELADVMGAVTKASAVMGTSVADTGQAMFTASNIFGYSSEQAEEVASKLVYAANASALSLQQIGVALNYTAGTAKTAGVGLEPVLAMMATLRNLGVGASTIGTSMRTFFKELSAGGKAAKAIGGDLNTLGLTETLERFKKLDPRTFADLFSKPASSALQLLQKDLQNTNSQFAEFVEGIAGEKTKTALQDSVDRFGKDLPGAIQAFRNSLTEMADKGQNGAIGDFFTWLINKTTQVVDGLSGALDILNFLQNPIDNFKKFAETDVRKDARVAATGKAVGPVQSGFDPTKGVFDTPEVAKQLEANRKASESLEELKKRYEAWRLEVETSDLLGEYQDLDKLAKKYQEFAKAFEGKDRAAQNSALREYNAIIVEQSKLVEDAAKAEEKWNDEKKKFHEQFKANSLKDANEDLKVVQIQLQRLGETLAGPEWELFGQIQDDLWELSRVYKELGDQEKVEQIESLALSMGKLKDNSTFSGKFKQHAAQLGEFSWQAQIADTMITALDSSIQQLSMGIATNLVGAFTSAKTTWAEFGDMFETIITQMIASLIQMAMWMAALKIIKLATAAGAAPATGGTSAGMIVAASGVTKTVRQPTPFIAGDAGVEKVSITPRARVNRGDDGGSIVVQINGDVYGAEKFNEAVAIANKRKQYV